jgi:hypothetical protein
MHAVFLAALVAAQAISGQLPEEPVEGVLSITLPEGQTEPMAARLFTCNEIDCAAPETFHRAAIEDGKVVDGETAFDPITVPTRWRFRSSLGVEVVHWVEAPGYWSPRVLVVAANSSFEIPLLRTGSLTGHLRTPRGPTKLLRAEITPPPPGEARAVVPIDCPVDDEGGFRCELPAGTYELKLKRDAETLLEGHTVTVAPGEALKLGTL